MLYDIVAKAGKETVKAQATGHSAKGALRVFLMSKEATQEFQVDKDDEVTITVSRNVEETATGLVSIERVKRARKPRKAAAPATEPTPAE